LTTELFHREIYPENGTGGDIDHATSALRKVFGFSSLRPHQVEVLEQFLKGQDTLAVIPTGGGKSMCYALPAMMGEGVGIVISPLIALIRDQVIKFRKVGIPAAALDSMQSPEEKRQVVDALKQGVVKLLIISPERFALPRFREFLKSLSLRFVAVDEAHCISQWGSNFRPEYRKLGEYLEDLPFSIPRLALTATATKKVREDILTYLNLRDPAKILKAPMRENLRISVDKESKVDDAEISLVDRVWKSDGQGIVYAGTRKRVEQLARRLREAGLSATAYHAGLSPAMRESAQKAFIEGSVKVVVATNAFGLGIDKNDIRFVHHYGLPGSLENYVQEIGRAGRDDKLADCDMVFTSRDYHVQKFVIEKSHPPVSTLKKCFEIFGDLLEHNSEVESEDLYKTVSVKSMIEREEIISGVETLVKEGFLNRKGFGGYSNFDSDVRFSLGECDKISDFFKEYPKRKSAALTRLDSMMVYAGAGDLREQVLKRYFLD
jgi:ATP-dependent DNA helicase RecQ